MTITNLLVFILYVFSASLVRALIRLLRLSRMTRWQEPSLAGSEWSIGRARRTFRISVICGLYYSVNNAAYSGLCSTARGTARAGWREVWTTRGRGMKGERERERMRRPSARRGRSCACFCQAATRAAALIQYNTVERVEMRGSEPGGRELARRLHSRARVQARKFGTIAKCCVCQ